MRVLLVVQHGQEELDDFSHRVNGELQRLGGSVRDVRMTTCLHERSIGGRVSIPTVIVTVMVLYEESA